VASVAKVRLEGCVDHMVVIGSDEEQFIGCQVLTRKQPAIASQWVDFQANFGVFEILEIVVECFWGRVGARDT